MNSIQGKFIQEALVPLSYPDVSIEKPSTVGYAYLTAKRDLPQFDPAIHNAVMFDQEVSPSGNNSRIVQYSIPQMGEFCLKFRLSSDADRATFSVFGMEVSSFANLKAGIWYDLFNCPVNLFVAPYGQRFLDVEYKGEGSTITFRYLSTNNETREDAIKKSYQKIEIL